MKQTEYIKPEVPPQLRDCKGEPAVPEETATQADVSGYILDLIEAHGDCWGKLRALNRIME